MSKVTRKKKSRGEHAALRRSATRAKRSAAGKHAKRKGGSFERIIAKSLAATWPDGEFTRTPGSGGSELKVSWRLAGDISSTSPTFPFCVECKKQENWRLEKIHLPKNIVNTWWNQAVEQAEVNEQKPLLVFSRNRVPIYMALKLRDWPKNARKPDFFIKTKRFIVCLFSELERIRDVLL